MRLIFSIFLTLSSVCYLLAQQPYSNDYKLSTDTLLSERIKEEKKPWSNPQKATIFALALPGSGQIFNKRYLKAGIVYGGFVGLSYMFDFNRDSLSKYQAVYAAKIDGANTLQLFYRIALPISWPVFLTTGLVVGLAVWNEFLFALTFVHDDSKKPIATILFAFQSRFENNWGLVNASAVMMMAPIVILFMFFQRRFIAGLTSGASKG